MDWWSDAEPSNSHQQTPQPLDEHCLICLSCPFCAFPSFVAGSLSWEKCQNFLGQMEICGGHMRGCTILSSLWASVMNAFYGTYWT